jgi:hypothetical protein
VIRGIGHQSFTANIIPRKNGDFAIIMPCQSKHNERAAREKVMKDK